MSSITNAKFRELVESGEIPVDSHEVMLRITHILMEYDWGDNKVFSTVELLHSRKWTFGKGDLKFNRYACVVPKRGTSALTVL
jgi:hypothetical protein